MKQKLITAAKILATPFMAVLIILLIVLGYVWYRLVALYNWVWGENNG